MTPTVISLDMGPAGGPAAAQTAQVAKDAKRKVSAFLIEDPPNTILRMRSWQPGDRFRPLGAPGERKLQDIFVDAGVPRRLRSRVPVVLDEEGIIWLAGFRIADRVKMESTTTCSMRFSIEWQLNPWTLEPSDVV